MKWICSCCYHIITKNVLENNNINDFSEETILSLKIFNNQIIKDIINN